MPSINHSRSSPGLPRPAKVNFWNQFFWHLLDLLRFGAAIGLSTACTLTIAEVSTDTEELRRQAQLEEQERIRRQIAPQVRLQKTETTTNTQAVDLPKEDPCFVINTLQLDGDRHAEFAYQQQLLDNYSGNCIGHRGLTLITQHLSSSLISQGYVTTRIGIPEQEIASGTLRFQLIPGIIRSIRFADETPSGAWQNAFPFRAGDLLNIRDLEQGLEQMKRVPSQDVDITIAPGEAPGESDIVLSIKRTQPWRLGFTLDDGGVKATGKLQMGYSLAIDNPLGGNDLFSVTLTRDANHRAGERGNEGWNIQYSIPWGNWTLAFTESRSRYHQRIQGINQSFISSGMTDTQELRLQRLAHRSQASKTSLQFRTLRREQHSYLDDTEILVQQRTSVAAELGLQHRHYIGSAQIDLSAAHRRGVPWFDGMGNIAGHSSSQASNRYALNTLDVALVSPFAIANLPLRWNSAFRGQSTHQKLYAADQFSLGNRYTVRGFDGEVTLSAERGWYLRNEIETPLNAIGLTGQAAYIGLDTGRLSGPSANALIGRSLTGAVLGLRGGFKGGTYEIFSGRGLRKPEGFNSSTSTSGFQFTYLF